MVTKEQARTLEHFYAIEWRLRSGFEMPVIVTYRQNGSLKVWKTRPHDFRRPIKYGLRGHAYVTHDNAAHFYATWDEARVALLARYHIRDTGLTDTDVVVRKREDGEVPHPAQPKGFGRHRKSAVRSLVSKLSWRHIEGTIDYQQWDSDEAGEWVAEVPGISLPR